MIKSFFLFYIFAIFFGRPVFAQDAIQVADKSVVWIVVEFPGKQYGSGTGFVVAPEIIATNHHVIDRAIKMVAVTPSKTGDGKSFPIQVVWDSPKSDLALLKVSGLTLPPLEIAESQPTKGGKVTAIGYPGVADDVVDFKGVESTLTQGVIGRVVDTPIVKNGPNLSMIQHSAPINHGNSGGPLLDACGRVIGINEAKPQAKIGRDESGHVSIDQSDGIFLALSVSSLVNGLKASDIAFKSNPVDCSVVAGDATGHGNALNNWITIGGVSIAVILAAGALIFSLRKREVIRETFTQFQRRKTADTSGGERSTAGGSYSWILRGQSSDGQKIQLVLSGNTFKGGKAILGRDAASCALVLNDPSVSRRHASLELINGQLRVTDLGSTNGTWIDRERLTTQSMPLRFGQILTIGKVALKVEGSSI